MKLRERGVEYVHAAGLVTVWRDHPDLRPEVQRLFMSQANGLKWRQVKKGLESGARNER
ncbi:MAG TPA: hypothetical protein VGJ20_42785 [Xanthobacteraceae bacterium]